MQFEFIFRSSRTRCLFTIAAFLSHERCLLTLQAFQLNNRRTTPYVQLCSGINSKTPSLAFVHKAIPLSNQTPVFLSREFSSNKNEEFESVNADIYNDIDEDEQDWISDSELVRRATQTPGGEALTNRDAKTMKKFQPATRVVDNLQDDQDVFNSFNKKSIHKQEKDELVNAMREEGFVVDSTLLEIARDYGIPICYLGDVLVTWGVPPPIDPHAALKDLVTGEQAFSLLEALVSLDPTRLNERYSHDTLEDLCYDYEDELDLAEAFEFCVKEGYNLPFGIKTCLRTEQEEELLRVLSPMSD